MKNMFTENDRQCTKTASLDPHPNRLTCCSAVLRGSTPSAVFTCIGALGTPAAERGPSLASVYRVSLTVDVGEGQSRKLAAFIAPL